jgi:hypothetical protein
MERRAPHTVPHYIIYGFFALGLLTALAFRAILVVQHLEPGWVRPLWYFAVGGNFLFFFYRFMITRKRRRAAEGLGLVEKLKGSAPLAPDDREVLLYLLDSIRVSKENMNYVIISLFSILAILADLVLMHAG